VEGGKVSATLWSTAIVETEKIQVQPSERLSFQLEFRNHYVVLENHSGGWCYNANKKVR